MVRIRKTVIATAGTNTITVFSGLHPRKGQRYIYGVDVSLFETGTFRGTLLDVILRNVSGDVSVGYHFFNNYPITYGATDGISWTGKIPIENNDQIRLLLQHATANDTYIITIWMGD